MLIVFSLLLEKYGILPLMSPFHKILCPVDFSETSYAALKQAAELVGGTESELLLLHVTPFPARNERNFRSEEEAQLFAREEAEKQLQQLRSTQLGDVKNVRILVGCGSPAGVVIAETARKEGADLIIIGTHGLTGWRNMMIGSVTEEVIKIAPCPVMSVRHHTAGKS